MSKMVTLGVAAAAYVLGARAGRERYEQIMAGAHRVWSDPRVQTAASDAKDTVSDVAPQLKDRAADAIKQAARKARSSSDNGRPGAGYTEAAS